MRHDPTGTATTRYLYDVDTLVAELSGANAVILYRTPGVGYVRNGARRYEYATSLGSSLEVRDASANATCVTEYDAFGKEVYGDDDATGFELLGARNDSPDEGVRIGFRGESVPAAPPSDFLGRLSDGSQETG